MNGIGAHQHCVAAVRVQVDIPFNARSKIAYDTALDIVTELMTAKEPVDYFTVLATKHLIAPFRGSSVCWLLLWCPPCLVC